MYRLIILVFSVVLSFAIEISPSVEKNLAKNDAATRLMLVNYYFDKNLTKAIEYNNQVLQIDKYNKQAKRNKYRLEKRAELLKLTKGKSIDDFYRDLYYKNKYKEIKRLSKYLPVITTDYPKLITAKIYLWDGNYAKVHNILKLIKDKTTLDYVELSGYESFYNGDYHRAKNDFSILYNATGKLDYAYRLIDSLIYLGETDKASKFVNSLLKLHPDDEQLLKYQKNIKAKEQAQLKALTDKYNKTQDFADLQPLLYFLMNNHQKDKAYKLLQDYIKKHPEDNEAKYWYATYLSWDGNNKKALDILQKMVTERDYKTKLLIAKIYSWDANYDKSLNYINDILVNCPDKQIKTDAEELKGLIYFWKQDYTKAKPILEDVLKKKNSDEAKEALMVINGDLKPLIAKYKKLYKKDITNLDYILRIAQYSEKLGDIDTALQFYEKYNKLNPDNLNVVHRLAQLYLAKKDFYKAFSYYEYWAYKKGDVKSLYELAQNYYYAGFSKSAINVINDILKIKDYKPALDLKAKILRYSPKFVTNNDSKTVSDIFAEKNSKLLEVGNRLYFNGFYYDASKYYHEYLLSNPDDAEIRERYAYSLEFSDKYKPASGEFFLLTWYKKNCEILYHYAYNLEKSGKRKLAKKVYQEALKYASLPAPKFIVNFIDQWKKAWESQKIYNYKRFYGDKYKKNKYWTIRKQSIFDSVKFISLYLADISVINEYKKDGYNYYKVRFWQQYSTNKKVDKGYKTLTLKCKNHKCLIVDEKWKKAKYIPQDYRCEKDIELRLKNIDNPNTNIENTQINPNGAVVKKKINLDGITKSGIVIVDNVDRPLANEKDVLNIADINMTKRFSIKKGDINPQDYAGANGFNHEVGIEGYYYKDKTDIQEIDYGLFYQNNKFYINLKKWKLWQNDNERNGKYFTLHYNYNNLIVGGELGKYEGKTYLYPYVEYAGFLNYLYYQSITGKDQKTFCAVDNHLVTHHLVVSKYKGYSSKYKKELTDKWWSVELSKIDSNIVVTPQFTYKFDKKNQYKDLELYYYLSGWYQFNSKETDCYYSPSFYDSTYLEIHPVYKKLELIGKLGYSFEGQSWLYSYGFNFVNKWLAFDCMKNYSYKTGLDNYWYEECNLKAGVQW